MPNLAIIAKDSRNLSPARSTLAQLLHQAEQLRIEFEPLAAQLRRCDEAQARADRALATRDALLEQYDRAVGQAISRGEPRPDPPRELDQAEIALRQANIDAKAVIPVRDRLAAELQGASERGSAIQREVAAVTAQILAEEAVRVAEVGFTEAFKSASLRSRSLPATRLIRRSISWLLLTHACGGPPTDHVHHPDRSSLFSALRQDPNHPI
jgi:hypothetical protein